MTDHLRRSELGGNILMPATPEEGRVGDVWRADGDAHEMFVDRLNKYTITLKSVSEPQHSGWGFELEGWEDSFYRIREDLSDIAIGDRVHLYVPRTDFYILKVAIDTRWPSLSGWFGYQVGRPATPEIEDTGLYLHPSADENITVKRLFRPYAMLQAGVVVADAAGTAWRYDPPFRFIAEDGATGVPRWPLAVMADDDATVEINRTSHADEVEHWIQHAQVEPGIFDRSPDYEDYEEGGDDIQ